MQNSWYAQGVSSSNVLEYADPKLRPGPSTLAAVSIPFALLALAMNLGIFVSSISTYSIAYQHGLDRGFIAPSQSQIEVTTYTRGDYVVAFYVVDILFSIALSVVLMAAAVLLFSRPVTARQLFAFYVRWKILFAFAGAFSGVGYSLEISRLTRHRSVGSLPVPLEWLLLLGTSLVIPLLVRVLMRHEPRFMQHPEHDAVLANGEPDRPPM